ncbi:DUF2463 domain-containing protein [Encephalitozoon hellem]|uniref:DUF2463 domain-containing protein n=1 Tax=Encephalitozoon hellem TaxID=27973 RepID=A0A9Q9C4B2_ENCHE|nr:DUF2463 domain-containing protein [Encephalitozoon hellem]
MNANTNILEIHLTDEHIKEHRVGLSWKDIMRICAAPISMVLPIIAYLLLDEDTIEHNIFLKFIVVFPPLLYSGIHYLILFNKNRKVQLDSSSTPLSTFLNIVFLLLSATLLLSIIVLTIGEWNEDIKNLFSLVMSPFLVLSTYLLTTSCSFTQSNFQYTATNTVDILLDLLALLFVPVSITVGIVLDVNVVAWMFCFITAPFIIILIRLWRSEVLLFSRYQGNAKLLRAIIPIILLLIAITVCGFLIRALLDTFKGRFQTLHLE